MTANYNKLFCTKIKIVFVPSVINLIVMKKIKLQRLALYVDIRLTG